jgi:hypothetical protein
MKNTVQDVDGRFAGICAIIALFVVFIVSYVSV